jgi:hypothetical protein
MSRKNRTYGEGLVQVVTEDDSLSLDHNVLNEIMYVLQGSIKSRLWDCLVLLGTQTS